MYHVKAFASWQDVATGKVAHRSMHQNRQDALDMAASLPVPIVDVIDDQQGRIVADCVMIAHPAMDYATYETHGLRIYR